MQPNFWKLSQGNRLFTPTDIVKSIADRLVYVHKDTKAKGSNGTTQADDFCRSPIGDYFYLTHGNLGIYILGQFSGPVNILSEYGEGWLDRPFRIILYSLRINQPYIGEVKWWTPNENSTFTKVPDYELSLFEQLILTPYFNIKLADYGL